MLPMGPALRKEFGISVATPAGMYRKFRDRTEAGRQLAEHLLPYSGRDDVVVLALPRGGVPVGYEVANALGAPLDVFVVRKIGVPYHEELAMGALASGGVLLLNEQLIDYYNINRTDVDRVIHKEQAELERREKLYRDDRPLIDVKGKTVILVDDGLATGSTMRAAVEALRKEGPERIVVGVPVASPETCDEFRDVADDIVCAVTPEPFYAVGVWYDDFSQTTDDEVRELLSHAREHVT
jgi:putative phosphoribosyl transferase